MPNEDQAKFWTETAGSIWVANEHLLDEQARKFGLAAIEAAGVREGESVVDVGCGTGPTTVELARRVGPSGRVTGIDISPVLLDRARARAREEQLTNVDFIEGDAQTYRLPPQSFDLVFSRMGVMFFDDSVAAFTNLRSPLRPGGRITFICWRDALSNPWMSLPSMAAVSICGPPEMPSADGPGPFRFADADVLRQTLSDAGYTDVGVEAFDATMDASADVASDRIGFALRMGPFGDRLAAAADQDTRSRVMAAAMEAAAPYESDGVYRIPAGAWIVRGRVA